MVKRGSAGKGYKKEGPAIEELKKMRSAHPTNSRKYRQISTWISRARKRGGRHAPPKKITEWDKIHPAILLKEMNELIAERERLDREKNIEKYNNISFGIKQRTDALVRRGVLPRGFKPRWQETGMVKGTLVNVESRLALSRMSGYQLRERIAFIEGELARIEESRKRVDAADQRSANTLNNAAWNLKQEVLKARNFIHSK